MEQRSFFGLSERLEALRRIGEGLRGDGGDQE